MSPELLAAIAAIAAASFSLVTLVVTGSRERHRDNRSWIRENLLEAAIAYLDSSWIVRQNTRLAHEARDVDPDWFDDLRTECWRQNTVKGLKLTKIRLLGSNHLVSAAEQLYNADSILLQLAFGESCEPDDPRWVEARRTAKVALKATLDAFRHTLDLASGAPLGEGHKATWHHQRDLRMRSTQQQQGTPSTSDQGIQPLPDSESP